MEISKIVVQTWGLMPDRWQARLARALPLIVSGVLIILIATQLAGVAVALLAAPTDPAAVPTQLSVPTERAADASMSVTIEVLASWRPFGEPPTPNPDLPVLIPFPKDAPETSLALTLKGAASAQEQPAAGDLFAPENASAIIASGRQSEKVYHTGDTIEEASGTTLYAVFSDHVLLKRDGSLERLAFPNFGVIDRPSGRRSAPVAAGPAGPPPPPTQQERFIAEAESRESLSPVAATLSEHLTIAPKREGGRTIGFRVQPRGNGEVFQQLGLNPGDILTEINGNSLENGVDAVGILETLTAAARADVLIRRNGFDETVSVNLAQVQLLAEAR